MTAGVEEVVVEWVGRWVRWMGGVGELGWLVGRSTVKMCTACGGWTLFDVSL